MHDANHGTDRHDEVGREMYHSVFDRSKHAHRASHRAVVIAVPIRSGNDIDDFDRKPVARLDPFDFERTAGTRAARRCHIRIGNHTGL